MFSSSKQIAAFPRGVALFFVLLVVVVLVAAAAAAALALALAAAGTETACARDQSAVTACRRS